MKKFLWAALLLPLAVAPAWADKAAYCQAYARDFSDARAKDKATWQHKYQIALDACLASNKAAAGKPAPAPKPPKPVKAAVSGQPLVAKPVDTTPAEPTAPAAKPKLVVGTPAWNDYCAKKYTSFDAKTGTYLSHTGVKRRCLVTADSKG